MADEAAGTSFDKDMHGADWAHVYERQKQRADLGAAWLQRLSPQRGERALDMGCGPGFFTLLLADAVGPSGCVYAVDRSPDAIAHVQGLIRERDVRQVRTVVGDGMEVAAPEAGVDVALATMMLHHADDPASLLANVARWVRPGGRVLVAEYDPEGPGRHGPPPDRRVAPAVVRDWCESAGLHVLAQDAGSDEDYALLCERAVEPGA